MRVWHKLFCLTLVLFTISTSTNVWAWQEVPAEVPDLSNDGAQPKPVEKVEGETSLAPDQPFADPISPDEPFSIEGLDTDLPPVNLSTDIPAPAAAVEIDDVKPESSQGTSTKPEANSPASETSAAEEKSEQPIAAPAGNVRPIVFKGVEPGVTKYADIGKVWGEPKEASSDFATYEIAPFKQVDVTFSDKTAQSLVIHLTRAVTPDTIASQLGLIEFEFVKIYNEAGNTLGRTYAERGVTLAFELTGDEPKVDRILLKQIESEPFVVRALQTPDELLEKKLADITTAIAINSKDASAWFLYADIARQTGDYKKAMESIETAIALNDGSPRFALLKARIDAKLGGFESAIQQTEAIANAESTNELIRAQATQQLGILVAEGPTHDYATALKHHQTAIALAIKLASDERVTIRREAKHILIDAHSSVALNIAQGVWQKKETTVPQWLQRAEVLINEYRKNESDDQILSFHLACDTLRAQAAFDSKLDTASVVEQVQQYADNLTNDCDDDLYRQVIGLQLGRALVDAVDAQRRNGNTPEALQYADKAKKILTKYPKAIDGDSDGAFQLIRLYFLTGSIHAVQRKDHGLAVEQFEQAVEVISQPDLDDDLASMKSRGEWLVSMAVSYWETEEKEKAVKLTELGLKFLKSSVEAGIATDEALLVPYNNLSFMHGKMGEVEAATQYTNLAEKINTQEDTTEQR